MASSHDVLYYIDAFAPPPALEETPKQMLRIATGQAPCGGADSCGDGGHLHGVCAGGIA
jgi:hypothetical protein